MTCAYDALYLPDAEDSLSCAFEYAVHGCGLDGDEFAELFVRSGYAVRFGFGDPMVLAGMSGLELVDRVLEACGMQDRIDEGYRGGPDASPEYWAGWALAQYQWERGYDFTELFGWIAFTEVVGLYHPFHEADVTRLFECLDVRIACHVEEKGTTDGLG